MHAAKIILSLCPSNKCVRVLCVAGTKPRSFVLGFCSGGTDPVVRLDHQLTAVDSHNNHIVTMNTI